MDVVDRARRSWEIGLGCSLPPSGVHRVPGGPMLAGYAHVYLARIADALGFVPFGQNMAVRMQAT